MSDLQVTVEYFAQARAAAGGEAREVVNIAIGTALAEVIRRLAEKHGAKLSNLLLASPRSTIIAVDGAQVPQSDEITLRGGETIMIIPPISGGQP